MSSTTGYSENSRKRSRDAEGKEDKADVKDNETAAAPRGPPPPGYYGYPPDYPPPRGYESQPPHGYPPYPGYPPMYPPPYGMYPPYQPPMYGQPPRDPYYDQAPPPGAYYDHPTQRSPLPTTSAKEPRKAPADKKNRPIAPPSEASTQEDEEESKPEGDEEQQEDEAEEDVDPNVTARLKTYIKPRIPTTQEVLDRRSRKNAQSRQRAEKLRQRIAEIETKPEEERTEEEIQIWAQYEARRQRKNDRSRERALEKKEEIDRILAKPEKKRTKIEKQFLDTALGAKKRKNEGDRMRRQRLKDLGFSTKGTAGVKPGVSARGPLPPQYHQHHMHPYGGYPPPMHPHMGGYHPNMNDIPMSPLPTMPHHHYPHHMQSPGGGFGSPGMMPHMYPSPARGMHGTPGRHMPYMPPPHAYEQQSPPPGRGRVEQRRNPDGSMSIQIGGGGSSFGGQTGQEQPMDMFENANNYEQGQPTAGEEEGGESKEEDADV